MLVVVVYSLIAIRKHEQGLHVTLLYVYNVTCYFGNDYVIAIYFEEVTDPTLESVTEAKPYYYKYRKLNEYFTKSIYNHRVLLT